MTISEFEQQYSIIQTRRTKSEQAQLYWAYKMTKTLAIGRLEGGRSINQKGAEGIRFEDDQSGT
jgi:hypothetical protein